MLLHITAGGFENVLVIGADALSRYVDWTDRGTCILFGDAAGAVVVQVPCNELFLTFRPFFLLMMLDMFLFHSCLTFYIEIVGH